MTELVELFKALSDESRLRILNLLVNAGELCVCDMQKILKFSQPKVSRHLLYLKHAGLVKDRREGMWVIYSFIKAKDSSHQRLLKELKDIFNLNPKLQEDVAMLKSAFKQGSCTTYCVIYPKNVPLVLKSQKNKKG
ncbi:MAG: metalloregulator ArsR/SmtB family transcription factor [Bacteroidetes bacterium]|nr:metalloregulator ArsR/SmtB family transcription factor [Bacteroidota bacterium]MBU1422529.1 metalloregulator ArsR/SmtB family transcription factor [Bacteroidota bacterium]MBU2471955.1 metalloregulator ArsR/SmtB family transcription factor [Bacteroidota bacterium]MBU2637007.1 metalloregulator ArsR/SmtB family transcription factor [Bacteroidota bacterium]